MNGLILTLIIITSILLVLIVLVQNSKGGGLVSNFASTNQMMGVRKTTDFLEKATWGLAIALVIFCVAGTATLPKNIVVEERSYFETNVPQVEMPQGLPTAEGMQPTEGAQQ
ncbi:MAG: preprotein translocase subunit SecG [Bacteroidales bacterium]|jgi:preprotein translocase subunit SecG|nr:preprotein translocase subunit SecG [Bacteroidales bacterium]